MSDSDQGFLRPGWARPQLVAAVSSCVVEWERVASSAPMAHGPAFLALVQRSRQLESPCRSVGFGGVGHHLSELARIAEGAAPPGALREQLAIVKELLASARGSLSPAELAAATSAPAPAGSPPASLTPPPLLSGYLPRPAGIDSAASAAPPAADRMTPPRMLSSFGQFSAPPAPPPPAITNVAPPAAAHRPLPVSAAPPPPLVLGSPPPPSPTPPPPLGAPPPGPALGPVVPAPSRPGQPNLLVRSVLGLRAFDRKGKAPAGPVPASNVPPPAPHPASPSLLGLGRASSPSAPPQSLGSGYGGLPSLPEPPAGRSVPPSPLDRIDTGNRGRTGQRTPSAMSSPSPTGSAARQGVRGRLRRRAGESEGRWWIGALAALGVCAVVLGIVLVAVMIGRRSDDPVATSPASSASAATAGAAPATGSSAALPRSRLLNDNERLSSLLSQVHGRGKESAELRALLDEQAATAAQALQPGCVGPQCAALAEVGKLVTQSTKKRVKRRSRSPDALRARWMAGLEMPEIPVEDDPRVQRRFEFYTENPLGRETFQQMLFRCGAYKDAIQSTLIRRGMPKDLIAVAYAESGCYPLAKSPVGAEGLWQFIPDAARAYHLRIIEGVVDERHSPQKSTEAAIQYLSDLYAKFGEWDLVFSAYNVGPFGLAARLERMEGENVGFWELVDAEMLPGETADYAPAIQAIALILNNLSRLKFGAIQQRSPQMTMDLSVPPNTRLTMVARAAAMSLEDLRRLNLDIKGASTPGINGFAVQVPKDSVWQARDTLQELIKSKDDSDLCAPHNFDWGRQRFTPEMQEACARTLAARAGSANAPAGAP